jgi:ferredoxin--NADP+ reductase
MLGRRGPAQAAFTTPELKELGELADTDIAVDPAELELDPASEAALSDSSVARNLELLRAYAGRSPEGKRRTLRLRFCCSPVAILGHGRVEAVEIARNTLVVDERGRVTAVPTEEREVIPCGLVLRSVGYRGIPLPGVPFDEERATIRNSEGRVLGADGEPVRGVYCAGWIKRGPSGVIGTNKKDAAETVDALLADARAGALRADTEPSAEAVDVLLASRDVEVIEYDGWSAIDAHESGRGEPQGRPRVKLVRWDDLLAAARGDKAI